MSAHADAGKLTGHHGDPVDRLMKAIETVTLALFLLNRLETELESRTIDITTFRLRIEASYLVVKQAMKTLEGLK